ncbi:MAG: hypothetical protein WCP41_09680, partial [Verrucomicrobiota bacterium]
MHHPLCLPLLFTTAVLSFAHFTRAAEPVTTPSPAPDLSTNFATPLSSSIDNPYFRVLKNESALPEANTNIASRVIVALRNVQIHSP